MVIKNREHSQDFRVCQLFIPKDRWKISSQAGEMKH